MTLTPAQALALIQSDAAALASSGSVTAYTTLNTDMANYQSDAALMDPNGLNNVLNTFVAGDTQLAYVAQGLANFMTTYGAYVPAAGLTNDMSTLVTKGSDVAAEGIWDHLTSAQVQQLDNTAPGMDVTFSNLISYNASSSTVSDFMTHVGAEVDSGTIAAGMVNVTDISTPNFAVVQAIVDNLSAAQISGLANNQTQLDGVLLNLTANSYTTPALQTAQTAAVSALMTHVGSDIGFEVIATDMADMVTQQTTPNVAALKAIVDNLTPGQEAGMGALDATTLGTVLNGLSNGSAAAIAEVPDFMTHLGNDVAPAGIAANINTLELGSNYTSAKSIWDNITPTQASQLNTNDLNSAFENMLFVNSTAPNMLPPSQAVLNDFMNHLGAYLNMGGVGATMTCLAGNQLAFDNFSGANNYSELQAIAMSLTPAEVSQISETSLSQTLSSFAYAVSSSTVTQTSMELTVADFIEHVGAQMFANDPTGKDIVTGLHALIAENNALGLGGATSIVHYLDSTSSSEQTTIFNDLSSSDKAYLTAHHLNV